ncbi:AAA family ATPase [Clostridium sp. KNHs214]|uniref:ExeA family protein n=1 Tax=Clostridium sp. KNHs214 TaxID=1540257 RepID=UPI0005540016|nr:AAA family ATPase [Clostridium sp. KNHs214]
MFKQFYGMTMNPFEKGIKEKDAYMSNDLKEMISRLEYLNEARGIGLFTASPGSGKTFALRCFAKKVNPNLTKVIYLCFTTVTTTEFYRQFCISLGIEPSSRKSDMFKSIKDYMESMSTDKRVHYILVWDEAQYLNNDILKDLKLLMNFSMDSKDCFSLVLIGQPVLNNILEKQIHEALKQRIIINYNFEGFSEIEALEYINSRLSLAGASPEIFDNNAVLAAYRSCAGSIRRLNMILTKALIIGAQHEKNVIDTDIIMAAANEISLH